MLVPRIGTRIYDQLKSEGRILSEDAYEGRNSKCMYRPKLMSPRDLEDRFWWVHRRFYSLPSMIRRGAIGFRRVGWLNIMISNIFFGVSSRLRISPLDFY
jgi:hypothetical protein